MSRSLRSGLLSGISALAFAACIENGLAADLTWDPGGTGSSDGAGTWLAAGEWRDGVSNVDWNNTTPDNAAIGNGGAGGAISVGAVTAGTVTLNNFTGTYTLQGTGTTLTQSGGITIGSTAGNATFRGTGTSPSNFTISGAGGLTVNGSGLVRAFDNVVLSYTGQTTITNGVLLINAGSKPTGNFHLNGGMLTDYYRQTGAFTSGLGTGNNQIQIYGASGFGGGNQNSTWRIGTSNSTLTWGALGEGAATGYFNPTTLKLRAPVGDNNGGSSIWGWVTLENRLDLNGATRTIDVYQGGGSIMQSRATISGGITGSGASSNLIKSGGGVLFLTATTSNWGGSTTVSGGILDFGGTNLANIGGGSGRNISVAAGAGVKFNALSNAILNRIAETSDQIIVMTGTTANNLDFSSSAGANLPNVWLGNWASIGAKAEISGTIAFGGSNYQLGARESSGLLGIVGANKLTGSQGLIVGQTGAASGVRVELAAANDFTGDTVINTGAKLTIGNNLAIQNSVLSLGSAGGTFALSNGLLSGRITGDTAAPSPTFGGLSGSRNLSSAFSSTAGNNEQLLVNTAVTGFTLNVGDGKTVTYSGSIGGFGTGASGGNGGAMTLTKSGNGTQVLTGNNTYTGATTINGGILRISGAGSINTSSGITLNGGQLDYNSSVAMTAALTFTSGTLGGTNWTGSTLNNLTIGVGQAISPGNSPGTANTVDQEWANDGTYVFEVNNALGTAGADPGWDLLLGTGTLDITATSGNPFVIQLTSLDLSNNPGLTANFDDTQTYYWRMAEFSSITGFNVSDFSVNDTDFDNPYTGTFSVQQGGTGSVPGTSNQLYLTYVPVPEPGALALGALGIAGVAYAVRRRRAIA